jgi:hypothetical protein
MAEKCQTTYYERNKERIKKQVKEYQQRNKEKVSLRKRKWKLNNKTKCKRYRKAYKSKHKEKIKELKKKHDYKRRSQKRNIEKIKSLYGITHNDIKKFFATQKLLNNQHKKQLESWVKDVYKIVYSDEIFQRKQELKKQYYELNKQQFKSSQLNFYQRNPNYRNDYREKHKTKLKIYQNKRNLNNRLKVISFYSNNEMCCNICKENIIDFLTIDHINGGGRKEKVHGSGLYSKLVKNNFPDGFQILCWNCNCSKHLNSPNKKSAKYKVIKHYTNNRFKCKCCNKKGITNLTIDHINNDGAIHRIQLYGENRGKRFYEWLIKNNFPDGFQVLCWNCNCARGKRNNITKSCPHKLSK